MIVTGLAHSRAVCLILRLALGALFILAGLLKLTDISQFALVLSDLGVLPAKLITPVFYGLPIAELVLGAFVLAGLILASGARVDCGCFGFREPISWLTLVRQMTMILAAAWCRTSTSARAFSVDRWCHLSTSEGGETPCVLPPS